MKTGPELMTEIAAHVTLDRFLDRNPHAKRLSDEDLLQVLEAERAERAHFLLKEQKRKDKKAGVEELPEGAAGTIMDIDSDVAD